ncbi:MAG: glycosyltransferase family 4 protein, partial [Gammaproteobacteria bacterium]
HRSLHAEPTPRGGGLSIVILVLSSTFILWLLELLPAPDLLAIGVGGLLVAVTGWLDDHYDVPALWRAIAYLGASVWAVYWVMVSDLSANLMLYVLSGIAVIAIAWLTNLYNFMDGSDGLAAGQAIFTGMVVAVLLSMSDQTGLSILLLVLAGASSGFLIWNRPPAKIFMGDAGSCLVGFMFAVTAMITATQGSISLAVWLILLAVFICDASLTLLKRILNRERWYQAHRSHAYQLTVQYGFSHKQLLAAFLLLNIILLIPSALMAYFWSGWQWWVASGIYILMSGLWIYIQLNCSQENAN